MAEGIILEFPGLGKDAYDAVNAKLGLNPHDGSGEWPEGMLLHTAGETDDGGLIVAEIWASREAQAAFMDGRLGRALQEAGVTDPPARVTWVTVIASHTLSG